MGSNVYGSEQYMQETISGNQPYNPAVVQEMNPPVSGVPLSPYAPVFNPSVPPPSMHHFQNHRNHSRGHPNNFPQQSFRAEGPPINDFAIMEHGNFQPAQFNPYSSQHPSQQHSVHSQMGHHNYQNYGRRGGHGGYRGRGRRGHDQFRNESMTWVHQPHQYQFSHNSGRRPRQQQNHSNERRSRNDYGDLLYSHADVVSSTNNSQSGNDNGSVVNTEARNAGDRNPRNVYVRKVNGYRNRDYVNSYSAEVSENETHSAQEESRGHNRGQNETPLSADAGANIAIQNESRQRNTQSAPSGRKQLPRSRPETDKTKKEDRRVQMEDQLKRGRYECMICCENIRQEVAVWSCQKCYHVFHLRCTKQWARSSLEGDEFWRCPACQNSNANKPSGYRCFCGKMKDPKFQPGDTPHSCGELCGRKGKGMCTHKCTLLCHPGPCPPCNAVVHRTCDCGAEKKTMRCGQNANFKCEKVCGKDLNCGQHQCQIVCHEGDCLPCKTTFKQACYGNHKEREVICGSEEAVVLSYSCLEPCGRTLKCDNHVCEDLCHPGDCDECPLLPEKVTHCCCRQTSLADLKAAPRTSCLDPVPVCDKICGKPMVCGPPDDPHICQKKCHEGSCGQCEGMTTVTCVCGANQKDFPCRELDQFTAANPFKCEKRCKKTRMCGRHKCNEFCCTREVHICEIICGRLLSCGLHKCEQLCHRGNCRPCLQSSFEELTCHCGAEVLYPPVPCGTRPPECYKVCTRQHNCNHPVRHLCHSDTACPPCTELVQKPCLGEHEIRKNVPCYASEISCGRQCGKPLSCGQHKCNKLCHKGPCLSESQNESCTQPCTKKRKDCPHPCGAPCHAGSDECPQTLCKAEIEIKCSCGNRTAKVQCQAGSSPSAEIAHFQRLTVQAMASSASGQEMDISHLTTQKKNTVRQLECTSTCAQLERNRRLALALEIQNPDLDAKLNGPKYSDFLKDIARKQPAFMAKLEKNFADLVQNAKQSKQPSRSFAFPSMNREQRRAVHELAESYGCETQSYDYEPNKNVVATAYRNKCFLPPATLSATISRGKGAPPPIPHHVASVWNKDKPASTLLKEKDKEKDKPDIDYFDFSSK